MINLEIWRSCFITYRTPGSPVFIPYARNIHHDYRNKWHFAIKINDIYSIEDSYISVLPDPKGTYRPSVTVEQQNCDTFISVSFTEKPSETIKFPWIEDNSNSRRRKIGLSAKEMVRWWIQFKGHYQLNIVKIQDLQDFMGMCQKSATCTMAALIAGGSLEFIPLMKGWRNYNFFEVQMYIHNLIKTLDNINDNAGKHDDYWLASGQTRYVCEHTNYSYGSTPNNTDIMGEKEWKRVSDEKVWFGSRRAQIVEIDNLLSKYWGYGRAWTEDNYNLKFTTLLEMTNKANEHIKLKPDSDRAIAVLRLRGQCFDAMRWRQVQNTLTKEAIVAVWV